MQPAPADPDPTVQWLTAALLLLPALLVGLTAVAAFFLAVRPWLRALLSGAPVSLLHILGMRLRGRRSSCC